MIIALAGRRIDALDAKENRFPLAMEKIVFSEIRDFFRKNQVKILAGSAACGADLLAQKAARELRIERYVILPFSRAKFREKSVADRPGDWGELFDEICDEVERRGTLIVLEGFEDDEKKAYAAATTAILEHAKSLESENEKVLAVAVWDGKAKDESDETASFIKQAQALDLPVKEIPTG